MFTNEIGKIIFVSKVNENNFNILVNVNTYSNNQIAPMTLANYTDPWHMTIYEKDIVLT